MDIATNCRAVSDQSPGFLFVWCNALPFAMYPLLGPVQGPGMHDSVASAAALQLTLPAF